MKRISVVVIGIVFLLAGIYTPVLADSGHGSSAGQIGSARNDALSNFSVMVVDHIKEVYTTLAPGSGSSYNALAVKNFYAGENIYFIGRVFFNNPGPYTVYTLVTDAGGKVVLFDSYGYTADTQDRVFWYYTDTMTAGTYNCSVLINYGNGFLLSPTAFTFIVLPSSLPSPSPNPLPLPF